MALQFNSQSCPYCGMGQLRTTFRTHVHIYDDTLVHIPNTPTHTCDICGHMVYDEVMLRRLDLLIGDSGPPPNHHATTGDTVTPPPSDDAADSLRRSSE